jgi:hypothetical protein
MAFFNFILTRTEPIIVKTRIYDLLCMLTPSVDWRTDAVSNL